MNSNVFKIVIIDDDPFQIEVLTRKLKVLFDINSTADIVIVPFTTSREFIMTKNSNSYDYYIVDYEIEHDCNGVDIIKKTNLRDNGLIFTGNAECIRANELAYLKEINFKVIEKPKCKEIVNEAIRYFSTEILQA